MSDWTTPTLDDDAAAELAAADRSRRARSSSAKGANGERDVLNAFREAMRAVEAELEGIGLKVVARSEFATRKRLERGTSSRDIGNIPIISIEVKRQEKLNLPKAWEQTLRQATGGLLPVLVYRYNREPWRVRTYVGLTSADGTGRIVQYVVAEVTLVDFLPYFSKLYREFLFASVQQ